MLAAYELGSNFFYSLYYLFFLDYFSIYAVDNFVDSLRIFLTRMELKEFSLIPDDALEIGVIFNATEKDSDKQEYGCGCFWFIKK